MTKFYFREEELLKENNDMNEYSDEFIHEKQERTEDTMEEKEEQNPEIRYFWIRTL